MKRISILGDSISTFEGYNPPGYAVYYNTDLQKTNALKTVDDTWWAQVNQALHGVLCVNNSYSGSKVSGKLFPAGESGERLQHLKTETFLPDMILIYLGFNDFGNSVDFETFSNAYDTMLVSVKLYYPNAKIVCATLMRANIRDNPAWRFSENEAGMALENYNTAIRNAAQKHECFLADIALAGQTYETLDGAHPTVLGHATMAKAWINCLAEQGL